MPTIRNKAAVLTVLTSIILLASAPSSADRGFSSALDRDRFYRQDIYRYDSYRRYRDRHFYFGHYRHFPGRYQRGIGSVRTRARFGHARRGPLHGRLQRRWHGHSGGDSLLTGIVLGAVLGNAWRESRPPRYRPRPAVGKPRLVTVRNQAGQRARPVSGRRLLRDLAGNCFEIGYTGGGHELRTRLHPSVCDF